MTVSSPRAPMVGAPGCIACAGVSPFHLSAEQIAEFDARGFIVLRNRILPALLTRIQKAAHRWIAQAHESSGALVEGSAAVQDIVSADFNFALRPGGRRVPFRVNYLHAKTEPASLELLGAPEVLGIAESLCGPDFVPTYESMVFKMPGDGELIAWHQDAVFPRNYRVFNIDVYLDRSTADAGAVRVIPGSQNAAHDVCALNDGRYDWAGGPHEVLEMEPGDVLVHDDMVLHGSPPTTTNALRRTIYLEFRPARQIFAEGPWDESFVDQRLRLVPLALAHFRETFRDRPQFQWRLDEKLRPAASGDIATELRIAHRVHTPGSYCSANSTTAVPIANPLASTP